MKKQHSKIYVPAAKFIPGTNLYTTIEQWEVVDRKVYVTFTDGFVTHSEETAKTLREKEKAGEIVLCPTKFGDMLRKLLPEDWNRGRP